MNFCSFVGAAAKAAQADGVVDVFLTSAVLQVFRPIVCLYSIDVVYLKSVSRTNKGGRDETMNKVSCSFRAISEANLHIASTIIAGLQASSGLTTPTSTRQTSYSAMVRNQIVRPTFNC